MKKIREQFLDLLPGLSITEKLFDTFEDVVFCVKERSGRYVLVNKAFVHRLNLPNKEAVLGRTARELFPAALAETYERQDAFVFGSGREIQNTLEMNINGDGTTGWYLSQKIPLFDGEKQMIGLVGISQDLKTATGQDAGPEALAAVIAEIQRDYEKPLRMEDLTRKVRMADY